MWIKCSDRMPDNNDKILVLIVYDHEKPKKSIKSIAMGTYCYCRDFRESVERLDHDHYMAYTDKIIYNRNISGNAIITHWQPLPDYPVD